MDFDEMIKSRRSVRRFRAERIPQQILMDLVDAGRSAPSGANRQPLEYIIVDDADLCEKLFGQLKWAGYVRPRRNPPAGKRPVAYIVVLSRAGVSSEKLATADAGAAIENILLSAWSKGIGSCWIDSANRENIKNFLNIGNDRAINSVIALGYPDEHPVMEDTVGDSIEYYLDDSDVLHVPKRHLEKIVHINGIGKR